MILRKYQSELSAEAVGILKRKNIVYLAMEVRTGKTLTALATAEKFGSRNVLFLTKKKSINSIQFDYDNFYCGFNFKLTVINDESLHLIDDNFDLVIHDEHHRFGAFPKPNQVAKLFKKRYSKLPMIFLSGTPHPESYSQIYHQFWVSDSSPFRAYTNFYKWAAGGYVNVVQKRAGMHLVNDYSDGVEKIIKGVIRHFMITFTQKQAGFTTAVNEVCLDVEMKPITHAIIAKLRKDKIAKNKDGNIILADTGAKMMQKIHQLSSGTCKFEDGTSRVIDLSKIEYISENFNQYKIAIFYKYTEELNAIKQLMGDRVTTDLDVFNENPDKWIALQITAGREGISLKEADYLVYYNIDYSAVSYWQSRDRLTTMERKTNQVFYIFSKGGIEQKIYQSVLAKKNYTLSIFNQDYDRAI